MTERRKELDIEPALVPQLWEDAVAACLAKDRLRTSTIGGRGCATDTICLKSNTNNPPHREETKQKGTAYRWDRGALRCCTCWLVFWSVEKAPESRRTGVGDS